MPSLSNEETKHVVEVETKWMEQMHSSVLITLVAKQVQVELITPPSPGPPSLRHYHVSQVLLQTFLWSTTKQGFLVQT